jgi:hypothetical protein
MLLVTPPNKKSPSVRIAAALDRSVLGLQVADTLEGFLPASELQLEVENHEFALYPVNFDNQFELSEVDELLSSFALSPAERKAFLLGTEEEDPVRILELVFLNNTVIGALSIELRNTHSTRSAVMNCLVNLEVVDIDIELVKAFISKHIDHLAKRQNWKALHLGAVSNIIRLSELTQ